MKHAFAVNAQVNLLLSGSSEPDPSTCGMTTDEERVASRTQQVGSSQPELAAAGWVGEGVGCIEMESLPCSIHPRFKCSSLSASLLWLHQDVAPPTFFRVLGVLCFFRVFRDFRVLAEGGS